MAKKVAFVNNKGGSAKTTSVVNIAGAYALQNPKKKILIIETDGQGNAARSFNLKVKQDEASMYDVFMGTAKAEDCIMNAYRNIDIIPANESMNFVEFDQMRGFELGMGNHVFDMIIKSNMPKFSEGNRSEFIELFEGKRMLTKTYFNMLEGKLDKVDELYDVIFFDTPPEIKAITSSVITVSDSVVIPFEPDIYSIDGIVNILKRINSIKKDINPELKIAGIMAVKVRENTLLHKDVINMALKYCMNNGYKYYQPEIPNSIRFASSISYKGLPATITATDNKFVQSYEEVMESMVEDGTL